MRDLRILSLHGYHGSACILRSQMAPLASALPSNVEFVYVDAPSLTVNDFGWWHSPSRGWDRTQDWAIELFSTQRPFDGVFGFSQGAALTGLLAGLRQNQLRHNDPESPAAAVRFDFAIMVGGFKNDAPQHAELFQQRFTLPSAHVIGRRDGIIPPRESHALVDQFVDPVVLEHPRGHVVPADQNVVTGLTQFLDRIAQQPVEMVGKPGDAR
ncbi:MAG: hypothetical protein JWR52_743 [Marmoricola sp.]|nr:hypothetical protein [Marmoricola sp.]